jgi:hypothetical protein
MQIKITYKEKVDLEPYGKTRIINTPFSNDGQFDDWTCGFIFNKNNNSYAFQIYKLTSEFEDSRVLTLFAKKDYSFDDYLKWLGRSILKIEIDGVLYFSDEEFVNEEENQKWGE